MDILRYEILQESHVSLSLPAYVSVVLGNLLGLQCWGLILIECGD
jgi:hypothetical protein